MRDKIRIKVAEDNRFTVRLFQRMGIDIYDIEYWESGNIYTIDNSDLDKIPIEVEVLSYKGFRGLIRYIEYHKHFVLAVLLSILEMFAIGNIVLKVEIVHNDKQIRELVEEELEKYGIHPLMIKSSFAKIQNVKERILEDLPENLEWLEIIDDGMKYTVRIEERIITEQKEEPEYCDIVSTKDAMVLTSKVEAGQQIVDLNDYVKKDSVLISGAVKFNEATKSYVCARGEIYGNTWYTVNVSVPFTHTLKDYTGKTHRNFAFEYGSKRTSIFKVHFEKYDTDRKVLLKLGKFVFYSELNREYVSKEERYTEEEVRELALKLGREKIGENLDRRSRILDEKVLQSDTYNSIIEMDIFYSISEPIGRSVEREIPTD